MEKQEQQELEEEEEAPSLKIRRSRTPIIVQDDTSSTQDSTSTTTKLESDRNSETNGHIIFPSNSATENEVENVDESVLVQEKEGSHKIASLTDIDFHKDTQLVIDAHSRSDSCVYYDPDEEPKLNSSFSGDEYIGRNPADGKNDTSTGNFSVQKSFDYLIDCQVEGSKKDKDLSSLHQSLTLSESDERGATYKSSATNEIETEDIDLICETGLEGTDIDVERVLEKQNTHDLYCPNCNSCITRRVILHKRKRRIRITGEDVKRNKLETAVDSSLTCSSGQATNIQVHSTAEIQLDGTSIPAVNDSEREREPDIFRCLSCFSFFIPTGNGFKLFRIFGDKGEKVPIEDQQKAIMSKSWISSFFASGKKRTLEPDSGTRSDAPETTSGTYLPESHVNGQKDLSPTHGFKGLVRSGIVESQEDKDKISPSSTKELFINGKEMLSAGDNSNNRINKKDAGDVVKDRFEAVSGDQPNTSNISIDVVANQSDPLKAQTSKIPAINGQPPITGRQPNTSNISIDVVAYHQSDPFIAPSDKIPVINGESPKDAVSVLSSHGGSPTSEKLRTDQNPDLTIQKTGAVDISREDGLHVGAMILNNSVGDKTATFRMNNYEGANLNGNFQLSVGENIEGIHAGELFKISKDPSVLKVKDVSLHQEQPATIAKDLRKVATAEISAGKDAVIVVESETISRAASQRAQDLSASEETGASRTLATHISVTESRVADARQAYQIEIIKSIVYGGLVESITSLGIVSSAAGGNTATLNILALAFANVVGGLILIGHNLWDLKQEQVSEQMDRYKEQLGCRENFLLHMTIVLLSFLVFGLIPPITYGFSFRKSDNRELKLLAVAAASLVCILVLAIGKEYVRRPPKSYLKTILYYVIMGFMVSGVCFAVGVLIKRLLGKLHFHSNSPVFLTLPELTPTAAELASY
ncbi:hypothetical protein ACH5RR_017342 [Cinchona calisaya]|uniref:Membrane protein of ER body-like protein n=1 Tax=Cinchona calisaya TaxID=153742 RepID=A0ABD3A466_9GENT